MARVVTSPAARWPGTIRLNDDPTLDQVVAWLDAVDAARRYTQPHADPGKVTITSNVHYLRALLPGALAFAQKWELGGGFPQAVTPQTFPGKPIDQAVALAQALVDAAAAIIAETQEPDPVPNA